MALIPIPFGALGNCSIIGMIAHGKVVKARRSGFSSGISYVGNCIDNPIASTILNVVAATIDADAQQFGKAGADMMKSMMGEKDKSENGKTSTKKSTRQSKKNPKSSSGTSIANVIDVPFVEV